MLFSQIFICLHFLLFYRWNNGGKEEGGKISSYCKYQNWKEAQVVIFPGQVHNPKPLLVYPL